MNKQKGFTIVELLVVVLIIGVLSGVLIGVLNTAGVRAKSRDAQRKADLKRTQVALEVYFVDNRVYPSTSGNLQKVSSALGVLTPSYINALPSDPSDLSTGDNPCDSGEYGYYYSSSGTTYLLQTLMEVETSNDDGDCGCSTSCYQVTNP